MPANMEDQVFCHQSRNYTVFRRLRALLQHLSSVVEPDLGEEAYSLHSSKYSDSGYWSSWSSTPSVHGTGKYAPLTGNQKTRLLVLTAGHREDELRGDLKIIRCLEDHDYEALSYAWGEEIDGHKINCGGDEIQITPNLDAALRELRSVDHPRVLWVDSICVNQQDTNERNQQVKIFRQIYSNARQVLIWLGETDSVGLPPLVFLQQLQSRLMLSGNIANFQRLGWYRDANGRIYSGGARRAILSNTDNKNLTDFFLRDWFHRTWIIQEVASAKCAVVICGSEAQPMKWEEFARLSKWYADWFLPFNQLGNDTAEQALMNITAIESTRRSLNGSLELPLFHILLATSLSKCRDQRDKIFAVMGLSKDWRDAKMLLPDYNTGLEDVYSGFAIADCNFHKSVRILSCASGPRNDRQSKLPSWVPDWRDFNNSHPLIRHSDRTGFSASGNTKLEAWFSNDRRTLHIVGKYVDKVDIIIPDQGFSKLVSYFELNSEKIAALRRSREWLYNCYKLALDDKGCLTMKRHNELWRTLICGLTNHSFPAPTSYSEHFKNYMNYIRHAPEDNEQYMKEAQTAPDGFRSMDEKVTDLEKYAAIESALHKWSINRRFCKTETKRLAYIPKGSRPGDVIYVLFGADVPYVLRPVVDDCFEVVGECYVDDIMHGEIQHDVGLPRDIQLI